MKAKITEPDYYFSEIKVIDIYPASEEEAQLSCPDKLKAKLCEWAEQKGILFG